jgi:histidinol-phosphate aminotransferase
MLERPDWKTKTNDYSIDLSKNVHYDKKLTELISAILPNFSDYHEYPNQSDLYTCISDYYNIPLDRLTIGYGATEVLDRIFKTSSFSTIYVVEPTFEMIKVYCDIYNKKYIPITFDDIPKLRGEAIYVANPSGNTGEVLDFSFYIDNFDLCLIDEAYADFYTKFSLLHTSYNNVIIVKTLSKSLGIAGFRVGFCKASVEITKKLQLVRSNFICNTFASKLVPILLPETTNVVKRMLYSKEWLENNYEHKVSHGNYVLFKKPNKFTDKFRAKIVEGHYRMALADIDTLTS